tara:strand:- start:1792 stop:2160 length:369 start_codon:yes stop_codon:yes gene_type:complete
MLIIYEKSTGKVLKSQSGSQRSINSALERLSEGQGALVGDFGDPRGKKVVNGSLVDDIERLQELTKAKVISTRNKLLKESDWTQLGDAKVNKKTWGKYRQELRDIPQNTKDWTKVVWPKKPQ